MTIRMICRTLMRILNSDPGYKQMVRLLSTNPKSSTVKENDSFKATIQNIFSEENKVDVQKKLSTVTIPRRMKLNDDARRASVLIPLCTVNREPSVLFMVRPMTIPDHRGEVCFPGGKMDDTDRDLVHTALRESHEEIGLPEDHIDIWGQMNPVPSRDGSLSVVPVIGVCGEINLDTLVLNTHEKDGSLSVVPVIGVCGEINLEALVLNTQEAECVFTRTIESLCANVHSTQYRSPYGGYTLPLYTGSEHRIWGLTAIFLHQLLPLLIPDLYTFKLRHKS